MEELSTGQAARLVEVHESTIKRWCDAGDLLCSHTEGGHRRIALRDLLAFARANTLECPLLVFGSWAEEVWMSLQRLQDEGEPDSLVKLLKEWLDTPWTGLPGQLMAFCLEQGVSLSLLFDDVLRPVLYSVGEDWRRGRLEVGDEHRMTHMLRDALVHMRRFVLQKSSPREETGVAVVGCAGGTEHEMGALMVRILLEARGWEVVFLGGRVPVEDFILQQQRFGASLVCISVTPPLIPSDARRIVQVLARIYDANQPFYLAMGGSVVAELTGNDVADHPFKSCQFYDDTARFDEWLEASQPKVANPVH